jgi:hypothetical protein
MVLRNIFRPMRQKEARELHNGELHALYSLPITILVIKSRIMGLMGNVAFMGERKDMYKVLMGKPEGKRLTRRPRRR